MQVSVTTPEASEDLSYCSSHHHSSSPGGSNVRKERLISGSQFQGILAHHGRKASCLGALPMVVELVAWLLHIFGQLRSTTLRPEEGPGIQIRRLALSCSCQPVRLCALKVPQSSQLWTYCSNHRSHSNRPLPGEEDRSQQKTRVVPVWDPPPEVPRACFLKLEMTLWASSALSAIQLFDSIQIQ